MQNEYDLVVLGSGSAASHVAHKCRAAGWRVAVVEARALGGTCALRGCEPKKTLWTVAEAADRVRRLGRSAGLAGTGGLHIDWPALMAFKRDFTDPVPARRAADYAQTEIDVFTGVGRFAGHQAVEVEGRVLAARHVLIATGAKPAPLPIPGADHLITSDDFLELPALPERIVLVGGGYISFEFAHIAARAGAAVTILHEDQHPLDAFDQDLVERLVAHSRRVGIGIALGARAARIEPQGGGVVVYSEDGRRFDASIAVHGLGRVPDIDRLDLLAGGGAEEDGRLKLDAHLRSVSNPTVFAAGDAAGRGPALTPVASHDADCVARNLLEGCRHEPDYTGAASAVFAIPPLAMAGMTEAKVREDGRDVEIRAGDMDDYLSTRREGHAGTGTAFKVVIERGTGQVLGAHVFAPDAHEAINLFALAIRLRLGTVGLGKLLSAYPSTASNIVNMLE